MRPNLSPFEYGAYGTPFNVVSVEVGGPQESSDGRAAMMSVSDMGAMIATCSGFENTWGLKLSPTRGLHEFRCVEMLVGH